MLLDSLKKRFTVAPSSIKATTISPFCAVFCFFTITISPFNIPIFIILSPCTFSAKSSSESPDNMFLENARQSWIFSVARIGLPHATVPTSGMVLTATLLSGSLSTSSILLFLAVLRLILPISSSLSR